MKILNVRWRNFASWGNAWHELDFDGEPTLSLLCGENGAGKSCIPNLIVYMLYGQVDGFNQNEIPNRINKHFEGIINIESGGHSVCIHRGLMPNLFEVTVDGVVVDTAGKSNVQKYLETEIYKTPYNVFKNSIVLSVDVFKSFVVMSPKEKSDIIDRLFGYSIINEAYAKAKDCVKQLKDKISNAEASIEGYNVSISEIETRLKTLSETVDDNGEDIDKKIVDIESQLNEKIKHFNAVGDAISKLENLRSDELNAISNTRLDLKNVESKLDLYKKGICPLCGSKLDTEEHAGYASTLRQSSTDLSKIISQKGIRIKKIESKLDEALVMHNDDNRVISNLRYEKAVAENERNHRITGRDDQMANLRAMSDEIAAKIAPKKAEMAKDCKRLELMNSVSSVFSNTGLKQYISDIYVPTINGYVEGVCSQLGIKYRIVFDTGYNCSIWSLGEEVRYSTLSRGERKKIDVAVTLAFLQIIKTKVTDLNILFLDEVLSGISVSGCNEMLQIFKKFAVDNGLSIYLVHHANLDSTYVDKVVEVEIRNGFSNFVEL